MDEDEELLCGTTTNAVGDNGVNAIGIKYDETFDSLTKDFLNTAHDPKLLRQISNVEVPVGDEEEILLESLPRVHVK